MNTNNELLIHIYETSDMGVKSTKKLLKILKYKDNKIKNEIERELKEYEIIYKKAKKILKKQNINPGTSNIIANISANTEFSIENASLDFNSATIFLEDTFSPFNSFCVVLELNDLVNPAFKN